VGKTRCSAHTRPLLEEEEHSAIPPKESKRKRTLDRKKNRRFSYLKSTHHLPYAHGGREKKREEEIHNDNHLTAGNSQEGSTREEKETRQSLNGKGDRMDLAIGGHNPSNIKQWSPEKKMLAPARSRREHIEDVVYHVTRKRRVRSQRGTPDNCSNRDKQENDKKPQTSKEKERT